MLPAILQVSALDARWVTGKEKGGKETEKDMETQNSL
jgi:hypothetical protein